MSDTRELEVHPMALMVPEATDAEYEALKTDIAAHGLNEPVVLYEGMVLDGRHRYLACRDTGTELRHRPFRGTRSEARSFVISANLARRHLSESQRAMVAARMAGTEGPGRPASNSANLPNSLAAKATNTSERSVRSARKVVEDGTPALGAAVERGEVAVSDAAALTKQAPAVQDECLAKVQAGEARNLAGAVRQHERTERYAALTPQALPERRYAVVYADPPWPMPPLVRDKVKDIRDHYPTMSVADIKALDVGGLLAPDAMLYLWVPTVFLPDGLEVMAGWGFRYSTNMVWVKPSPIQGFRVRGQHETLLVGMHGSIPKPGPEEMPSSVYRTERKETKHSRKPVYYYELLEKLYPGLAKIELFAREPRDGWSAWGNEGVGQ